MTDHRSSGFLSFFYLLGRGIHRTRLFISNLLFLILLLALLWLIVVGFAASRHARSIEANSVLVLRPQGKLVEQYSIDPLSRTMASLSGEPPKQVQLRDLTQVIDAAAQDRRITRLLLLPDALQTGGFAALRELGAALDRFRASGKPVLVWAADLDQGQYYLAAHANRILLDPQGGVMLTGLANYRLFYKNLLDKLGVQVHLFRVGQYKSAAEPYVLEHASPAAKQADSYWLGGLWDAYIAEVAKLRRLSPDKLRATIDGLADKVVHAQGDLAQLAWHEHWVDGVATRAQLDAWLRKQGVPAGAHGHGFRHVDFARYRDSLSDTEGLSRTSQPVVAVIVAEGDIVAGRQSPGSIGGESTAELIRKLRENPRVKALVLRINSPGGEVYAAEEIRRQVELTRQAGIPVIVSMGDVAASGGYWIGMDADRIFAEPNTITGSIGIFGMYYSVPGALAKLGINSDGVRTGPLAGAFDVTRPLDAKAGALIQAVIDKGYRDFVGGVAKARGQSFAAIDAIAQGRVWTGRQALARGLVDQLGGLRQAVAAAAARAGLKNYTVRYAHLPQSPLARLLVGFNDSAMLQTLQHYGITLPAGLARLTMAAPEFQLLQHAQVNRLNAYAYCFCSVH